MPNKPQTIEVPRTFVCWFYAAAVYNTIYGIAVILFPRFVLRIVGIEFLNYLPVLQALGMVVGVYAYGYYLLAKAPVRYSGLIWVGLAGKTFGPIGYLFFAACGELPWSFGWMVLANDLIWWPVFWTFALKYGRNPLGG